MTQQHYSGLITRQDPQLVLANSFQSTCASPLPWLCSLTGHNRIELNRAALIFMAHPHLRRMRWSYFLPISYLHVCWQANDAYTFPMHEICFFCHHASPSLKRNSHSLSFIDNGHLGEKCRTEQTRIKCAGSMNRRMIFGCTSKSIKAFWSRFVLLSGFNSGWIFYPQNQALYCVISFLHKLGCLRFCAGHKKL